jgi:hypothetical protein
MNIRAILKPGANSTMGLLREYGEQLVCVRYRNDRARRKRYKTVELICQSLALSCRKVLELGLEARIIDEVLKFKFMYMPTIYLHIEIKYTGLPIIGRYANVV